jgi:hypothetical protein
MESVEALAAQVGHSGRLGDEHDRFAVYRAALGDPSLWSTVVDGVAREPDVGVATDVLARLLELVPPEDRDGVLRAGPVDDRGFLATREAELRVLDAVTSSSAAVVDPDLADAVLDGSDWLQRRVVAGGSPTSLLERLAETGRTRKVRAAARLRAR